MIYRNKYLLLCKIFLCLTIALCGCGKKSTSSDADDFGIYYLDSGYDKIIKKSYTLKSDLMGDKIDELLKELSADDVENANAPLAGNVAVTSFEAADSMLLLHFNHDYSQMEPLRETLVRSSVSKTILQLDEVTSVSFYIEDEPIKDAYGNVIGAMTSDSFLDTFGEKEEALESDTFTLYYATRDGKGLEKKIRTLHFNNTMSHEDVVLDYLGRDPGFEDGARAVLSNTKVIFAATKDGICHVKLDASFLSQNNSVATKTAVYAIVDSLTALDNVNKVEISIDAGAVGLENDNASGLYEPDLTLLEE